ncbi:D-aminoacylase [subsurface metagenome]
MTTYELLIKNGNVIDGRGNPGPFTPWYQADVAISGEKIAKVGNINASAAKKTIDAKDLIVSPGFIDIHSHSDAYLIENPKAESKIRQGVTTEVVGNCGMSTAPVSGDYKPPKSIIPEELEMNWATMGSYLDKLEENGASVNVAPLVGHSNIRGLVMEYKSGQVSDRQLNKMKEVLEEALDSGAWGMSSGLIYPPGSFSDEEELTELCKLVKEYDGVYHTI